MKMSGGAYIFLAVLITTSFVVGTEKCNTPADIAFLIDSSSSIWLPHFEKQIEFVVSLLGMFNVGSGPDDVHVAALTFSKDVEVAFYFNEVTGVEHAKQMTGDIEHDAGESTNTHLALETMRTDLFSPENGARPGVVKICILLTDGVSSEQAKTLEQAKLAKEAGIIIMAIGIGNVKKEELRAVVTSPPEGHFFYAKSFTVLIKELEEFGLKTCEAIETATTKPEVTTAPTQLTTKVQGDQPKETCQGKNADIIIVIDSSSSIWPVDFVRQLEFLVELISNFDIESGKTRVGLVSFSNTSNIQFYLNEYKTEKEMYKAILALETQGGLTNTHLALESVLDEMFSTEHGSRRDVAHICLVFTDGESREPELTKEVAEKIHANGVDVLAIGVGDKVNKEELENIASQTEFVYTVDGYEALKEIEKILAVDTCEAVKPPQPSPEELNDPETEKICRGKSQDILIVVDMSNSIWTVDFINQLKFLAELVGFFDIDRGFTQVGMMTFSNGTDVAFYLNTYDTKEKIMEAILEVEQKGGLTNTHLALKRVLVDMASEEKGFRKEVDHTCIVITDGISRKPDETKLAAEKLHEAGMEVIAIGVGNNVDPVELQSIASKPEFVFEVADYDTLSKIKNMLARTTCEGFRTRSACEVEGLGDTIAFTTFIGAEVEVEAGDTLVFDKVLFNVKGVYDPTSGFFTAPKYGYYRFAFSAGLFWESSDVNAKLMKNKDSLVATGYTNTGNELVKSEGVAVLVLEEGDTISVQIDSSVDSEGRVFDLFSTFSGVFLTD